MVEELRLKIIKDYQEKIDDILCFCESPIEKLMVLNLFNYCNSYRMNGFKLFGNIEFIDEYLDPFLDALPQKEIDLMWQRINKYKHKEYPWFEKVIGFKAPYQFNESYALQKYLNNIGDPLMNHTSLEVEVIPQKTIVAKGQTFRIDVALYLNRFEHGKVIEQRKIALECDGYDFHSTRVQIDKDNQRARLLNSVGWKVLRYSGSELNSIRNDEQFHQYFIQITDIFYS